MKTFSEFVNSIDPDFFESFEKKEAEPKEKGKEEKKDGKKMPPWLKGKGKDDCDDACDDKPSFKEKKNPFLKGKKDKKD